MSYEMAGRKLMFRLLFSSLNVQDSLGRGIWMIARVWHELLMSPNSLTGMSSTDMRGVAVRFPCIY